MAVDSRAKGQRGEYQVRDLFRDKTGLEWERVPGSGAFGQNHHLKGDIYLPPQIPFNSKYCIEVKWFAGDNISSNILNKTESQLEKWWEQASREAVQMSMDPALIFKKDRGDWLIALNSFDSNADYLLNSPHLVFNKNNVEIIIGNFKTWLNSVDNKDLFKG